MTVSYSVPEVGLKLNRFSRFAWGLLLYNLFIIVWGAFVRASGSGAGCGAHWPLCNGVVIPRDPAVETLIEFAHRVTSGLTLVFVILLFWWARRIFTRRHPVRTAAALSVFFTITEALIGAGLVLFQLTAENESIARAYAMMAHLINTFLLTGCLVLTAWWSSGQAPEGFFWHRGISAVLIAGLVAVAVLGASGAVAALGDTLFPANSLSEALQQDFDSSAHILLRLRILHPMIAVTTGFIVAAGATLSKRRFPAERRVQVIGSMIIAIFLLQLVLGVINVLLLAPIWMQLVHLLVSELIWLSLVLLVSVVFGTRNLLPSARQEEIQ